ncbi:DUF1648 domain-containing protein [Chryseobacterium sp. W4I1]|uniref:DUF1648 domain-containing protein n=1 Tax=Chryseobacterium sp. W4I1 TaxID=3042293 RepID=UPI00278A906F|nr:DUF1648 domain-containing protein [Chryseobacterium sp. W4I1]MDQ0783358.1 putative membrane protein [Chryseobacterium sp. W4I1]
MENILFTFFDIFNFGLVVFFWWFTLKHYKTLPKRIPVHFDFGGKADNFWNKVYSFLTPLLGTAFYFLFIYTLKHPESTNFPVEITEQNRNAQFLIMEIFIRWLFLLLMLIFINGQDYMFRYTFNENVKPRVSIHTAILSVIGSVIIVFIFVGIFK